MIALSRAGAELLRRLQLVGDADWDASTPCEGWTVRDLLRHVDAGNRMTVEALHGGSREQTTATVTADHLGAEPAAAVRESIAAQEAAFAEPGALERVCQHPMFDTPGRSSSAFGSATWPSTPGTWRAPSARTRRSTPSSSRRSGGASSPWRR